MSYLKNSLGALLGALGGGLSSDNSLSGALIGATLGGGLQHGGKLLRGSDDIFASAKGAQQYEDFLSHTLKRDGSDVVSLLDKIKPNGLAKITEDVASFKIPKDKNFGEIGLAHHNRELYKDIGLKDLIKNENKWNKGHALVQRGALSDKIGIDKVRSKGVYTPIDASILV